MQGYFQKYGKGISSRYKKDSNAKYVYEGIMPIKTIINSNKNVS